jgi:hypothetical protein
MFSMWNRDWPVSYQIELLDRGVPIMPWFPWPDWGNWSDEHDALLERAAAENLPISFIGTQWEMEVLKTTGAERLSPFDPPELWRQAAKSAFADTFERLTQFYLDPPTVIILSNNEAKKERWKTANFLPDFVRYYGDDRSDEFKRRVYADRWAVLYREMFDAAKDALPGPWRGAAKFVGYNAAGYGFVGRWDAWREYTLTTHEIVSPDFYIWDGGCAPYYLNNWETVLTDNTGYSPQSQVMRVRCQWEEDLALENPEFHNELIVWDGNKTWTPDKPMSDHEGAENWAVKLFERTGEEWHSDRYLGYVRFGLWASRAKVLREFRGSRVPHEPWKPYTEMLVQAVSEVSKNQILATAWKSGELLFNPRESHPYRCSLGEWYERHEYDWIVPPCELNPVQPVLLTDEIRVWALIVAMPTPDDYLLFAYAPTGDFTEVAIQLRPDFVVKVDVLQCGSFYLCKKRDVIQKIV